MFRLFHQLGDDLDATGAGADDRHFLVREIVIVIPAGTVNLVALEIFDARNRREATIGQRPLGHHRSTAGKLFTFIGGRGPDALLFIEGQVFHVFLETDV